MRVFAPGAYTWENKGDAALVESFLDWLAESGCECIGLTSFTPEKDEAHYGVPVHPMVTRPFTRIKRRSASMALRLPGAWTSLVYGRLLYVSCVHVLVRMWVRLRRSSPRVAQWCAPARVSGLAREIERSDLVMTVPGGYLMAPRSADDSWLFHLPTLVLASALAKPLVVGPCSIGPFAPPHRGMARTILGMADLVMLREERSAQIVRDLDVPAERIVIVPDLAFAFDARPLSPVGVEEVARLQTLRASCRPLIGVSVRPHHFFGRVDADLLFGRYLDAIVDGLEAVVKSDGAMCVIVPQTSMDVTTGAELARRLETKQVPFVLVDPNVTPSDLQAVYAELDLLVGTRMHANILALGVGTPVVGIAYEPKTLGILEQLGLGEWGIRIDEVDEGRLAGLIRDRWAGRVDGSALATSSAARARRNVGRVGLTLEGLVDRIGTARISAGVEQRPAPATAHVPGAVRRPPS